jgi:phage shock protein A
MASYERQKALLANVRRSRGNVESAQRQLEAKIAVAKDKLDQLDDQARRSVQADREDIARFALQMRFIVAQETASLEDQVEQLDREGQVLSLAEQRLAAQVEAFFARQEVLQARYDTAEAHVNIQEALGGVSDEIAGMGTALEQAEQRTEEMQARVDAIDRLVEMGVLDTSSGPATGSSDNWSLDPEQSRAVDDRLNAIKRDLETG